MPPKKEKKAPDQPPTVNEIVLKKFLQYYDAYCKELNCFTCPDIINSAKQCLGDNKTLTKLILRPFDKDTKLEEKYNKALKKAEESNDLNAIAELKAMYQVSSTPPLILIEPMFRALNDVQYSACKDLFIDDLPLFYDDMVQITNFINIQSNLIQKIHIIDCIVNVDSIRRFASCFNRKPFLTLIDLDYNEFGDDGCRQLCQGLFGNQSIVSVSLNYCDLGPISGKYLGEILATTAVRELYIDGNDLRCQGVYDLIKQIAEEAEKIAIKRELEENIRKEEEEAKRLYEAAHPPESVTEEKKEGDETKTEPKVEADKKDEESGKKKKKKKKGKKKSDEPPIVGPFVSILHIADNSMDFFENGADRIFSLNLIHQTINLITKLIQYSPELEELDLHNNTIGNMSAKMILNALEFRQKKELNPSAVRVSEKIEKEMFDQIMKMGKKLKKKKGKKKKKK